MERNPQVIFERLFGTGSTPEERQGRRALQASILDSVVAEVSSLERGLGASDRARLDDYLSDLREIERRIALAQERAGVATGQRPEIAELPFDEHTELMFDLQVMAFKTDITRISTMMLSRDLSGAVYPASGVPDGYHAISHHQDNPTRMERYAKLNTYHMAVVSRFVGKLAATDDGEGKLLDNIADAVRQPDGQLERARSLSVAGLRLRPRRGPLSGRHAHHVEAAHADEQPVHERSPQRKTSRSTSFGDSNGVLEI